SPRRVTGSGATMAEMEARGTEIKLRRVRELRRDRAGLKLLRPRHSCQPVCRQSPSEFPENRRNGVACEPIRCRHDPPPALPWPCLDRRQSGGMPARRASPGNKIRQYPDGQDLSRELSAPHQEVKQQQNKTDPPSKKDRRTLYRASEKAR